MGLFKTIDGLLVGARYLAWGIGAVGIVASVVLFFANVSLGFASATVFVAALLLAVAVALLLWPKQLAKGPLEGRGKYVVGSVALAVAVLVAAVVYFVNGGFPELNLLFA